MAAGCWRVAAGLGAGRPFAPAAGQPPAGAGRRERLFQKKHAAAAAAAAAMVAAGGAQAHTCGQDTLIAGPCPSAV